MSTRQERDRISMADLETVQGFYMALRRGETEKMNELGALIMKAEPGNETVKEIMAFVASNPNARRAAYEQDEVQGNDSSDTGSSDEQLSSSSDESSSEDESSGSDYSDSDEDREEPRNHAK